MSRTLGSRARYKHKRATKRFESGKRTQPVAALVVPTPANQKKKRVA